MDTISGQTTRSFPKQSLLRVFYTLIALGMLTLIAVWTNVLFENSYNSDECLWGIEQQDGEEVLIVKSVVSGGRADEAGLEVGDRVLAINGQPVDFMGTEYPPISIQAQLLLNSAPVEEPISYVVERNGNRLDLEMRLVKITSVPVIQVVYAIFATLWLLIGLIVVLTRPLGLIQNIFFLTGVTVFFSFSGPAGPLMTPGWSIVWTVLGSLYFLAWLHFCSSFPVQQQFMTGRRRIILYGVILLPLVISLIDFIFNEDDVYTVSPATLILKVVCMVYFSIGIWLLFRGYRRMPPHSDRRPMRAILIGTLITACVLLYFSLFNVVQWQITETWQQILMLPAALFLALPISFGYAIFRYQLMDVRAVVKTALVYTLTTGTILGLYITLALRVGQILGSLLGEQMEKVVEIGILALFLLLFEPIRRWVQRLVDRRFFPQYRDYSEHLTEYAAHVTEAIGVPQVAGLIAGTLREHLALEAICVAVVNSEGELEVVEEICNQQIVFDAAGVQRLQEMLRSSHDLIRLNPVQEPELQSVAAPGFAYAIGLYAGGRLIGAILLSKRSDGKPISGSQISFINGVASQGASGIEAARLYERELERQRYEEELATARRIQQSLLPSEMPEVPGISIGAVSRPAMAVGGDYYELLPLPDNRFLVMIADVSGKGLPASLYMAELHGMVRIVSSIRQGPREMLTLLNRHLCQVVENGIFITASIFLLDLDAGTLTLGRAGHMRLIRQRGTRIETFEPKGLPLGVRSIGIFDSSLEEITLEYQPGDRFILYSDGLSEAMNKERQEFGEERLYHTLAAFHDATPDELNARLLREIAKFRGDADQNDEVTVVVVDVEENRKNGENGSLRGRTLLSREVAEREQET